MILTDVIKSRLSCLESYFVLNGGDMALALETMTKAFNLNQHDVIWYRDRFLKENAEFIASHKPMKTNHAELPDDLRNFLDETKGRH